MDVLGLSMNTTTYQLTVAEKTRLDNPRDLEPFFEKDVGVTVHKDEVRCIHIDNGKIYSGSRDGAIVILDQATMKVNDDLRGYHKESVNCITTNTGYFFSGSDDGSVCMWDKTNKSLHKEFSDSPEWVLSIAADESFLYCGYFSGIIAVWSLSPNAETSVYKWDHGNPVNAMVMDKDRIYTGGADGSIKVWRKGVKEQTPVILANSMDQQSHQDGISSLAIDEHRIYSTSYDKSVKIWDKERGFIRTLVNATDNRPFLFVRIEKQRIFASSPRAISVFHAVTGQVIQTLENPLLANLDSFAIATERNELTKFFCGSSDGNIQSWKTIPATPVHIIRKAHTASVKAIAVDETQFYTASADKTLQIWNKKTLEPAGEKLQKHKKVVNCLYVKENKLFSGSDDHTIIVWDKKSGACITTLEGHTGAVHSIYVDEGRIYSAGSDNCILIWDREKYQLLAAIHTTHAVSCVFVHEGRIYAGVDTELVIYDKLIPIPDVTEKPKVQTNRKSLIKEPLLKDLKTIQVQPIATLTGHHQRIACIKVHRKKIYTGSEDATVKIWDAKLSKTVAIKTIKCAGPVQSLYVSAGLNRKGRIFIGTGGTVAIGLLQSTTSNNTTSSEFSIEIRDEQETETVLQRLDGHKGAICALTFDEGRTYSGSVDKSVRVWELDLIDPLPFMKQCMTNELSITDTSTNFMNEVDKSGRTSLMYAARAGSILNAKQLLALDCLHKFDYVSDYGESAIFYALKNERWEFLNTFASGEYKISTDPSKKQLAILDADHASRTLLQNRAIAGDAQFFQNLVDAKIRFNEERVIEIATKHNHFNFVGGWKHINATFALHWACFYGRPDCVRALIQRPHVIINKRDRTRFSNRTAIHICHLNATECSDVSNKPKRRRQHGRLSEGEIRRISLHEAEERRIPHVPLDEDLSVPFKPEEQKSASHIPTEVFEAFEYKLIENRTECFKLIMEVEEISKKPKLTDRDVYDMTPYSQALSLHNHAVQKMKIPRRELTDKEEISRRNKMFADTVGVLDQYAEDPTIVKIRRKYANKVFWKESLLYLVFLILLSSVGMLNTTGGKSYLYGLGQSLTGNLLGDNFATISDGPTMWSYIEETFLPVIYSGNDGIFLKYNWLIGGVQLHQVRVKNDGCKPRSLYAQELQFCYPPYFTPDLEDKSSYGPNNSFVYVANSNGDWFWGEDGNYYPPGGFITVLSTNDSQQAQDVVTYLSSNGWVDKGTRAIFITVNAYSVNLDGVFAVIRLSFFFDAYGSVTTDSDIIELGAFTYDRDIVAGSVIKILLQFLVLFYIVYEFLYKEVTEIRESIRESRAYAERYKILGQELTSPVLRGIWNYVKQIWNWYEWMIIIVFLILMFIEISCIILFSGIDLHPTPSEYINIQSVATVISYEQDLMAFFILMNWLRMLKFLMIAPFTGPLVQNVLDTLQSTGVIVFVGIIIYIVLTFTGTYHIAFGDDVNEYQTFGDALMTLVQVMFGQFDFPSLQQSNRVFGPLFFVLFMFFIVLVLMNLLVGVLSEAYNSTSQLNSAKWNRFITRLMIQDITSEKATGLAGLLSRLLDRVVTFISNRAASTMDDIEADSDDIDYNKEGEPTPTQKAIFKTEDDLDDMVAEGTIAKVLGLPTEKEPAVQSVERLAELEDKLNSLEAKLDQLLTMMAQPQLQATAKPAN